MNPHTTRGKANRRHHPPIRQGTTTAAEPRDTSDSSCWWAPTADPSLRSLWLAASGLVLDQTLLQWPPDMVAFTHVALERTEAYRFVVSPPADGAWPPAPGWGQAVAEAARAWRQWTERQTEELPELLVQEWEIVTRDAAAPLVDLGAGHDWRLIQSLLTLHAMADQATSDGIIDQPPDDTALVFRARTRELLARTGSMARIPPSRLRVLPKYRTPPGGITSRSISRYTCVVGSAIDVDVNQIGARAPRPRPERLSMLLLPWPLQVSAGDFQPVPASVQERDIEPYGYFQFSPSEPFDLSLADRVLAAARRHTDRIDVVILPETAVRPRDVARLEPVLSRHGVDMLIAGVRDEAGEAGTFTGNWIHFGASLDGHWWHYRQDKHHRWSLDAGQIDQYQLGEVLDPRVRWWEGLQLRRRSLQLMERADRVTVASLVCEDLAHIDEFVDLVRDIGPTLLVTLVLDGPQLASRWTARYANVLADDPGSAVLTLSAYGMVRRARHAGLPPSSVVALWKDHTGGMREIELEGDAHAILLTADYLPTIRRAADGRTPELTASDLRIAEITQIGAVGAAGPPPTAPEPTSLPDLTPAEVSVLLAWTDAVTDAVATREDDRDIVLDDARPQAAWRADLNLRPPEGELARALDTLAAKTHDQPTRR